MIKNRNPLEQKLLLYLFFLLVFSSILVACQQTDEKETPDAFTEMTDKYDSIGKSVLTRVVKDILIDKNENWALFENGTFILVEGDYDSNTINQKAVEILKEDAAVWESGEAAKADVYPVTKTGGWLVVGEDEIIFNYVSPVFGSDTEVVGNQGLSQRKWDLEHLKIIYTNKKTPE
ncbi:MAG: hypothetical protein ACO1N0_21610 [Fluviicola sp.]